ncbi:MAG: Crp/Fnr family transcriptional regulator [Candidatus Brocadiales bacterium]
MDEILKDSGGVFHKGTVFFKEGDIGTEMYLINEGTVQIIKTVDGMDVVLTELGAGEFFGEMSLITNRPCSVSAEAITDCKLTVVNKDTLETLIISNPLVALSLTKKLVLKLEKAYTEIESLFRKSHKLIDQMKKVC